MNFVILRTSDIRNSMSDTATISPYVEKFCIRFDD